MQRRVLFTALSAALSAALYAPIVSAQGFGVDRFNPSERGSEWFALDSLDMRGDPRPAVGLVFEYAHNPLVLYNPDGSTRVALVSDQLFFHAGASLNLLDSIRIGADIPIGYGTGDPGVVDGQAFPAPGRGTAGDMRASIDLRLFGHYGDPLTMAFGGQMFVPSGEASQYSGDGIAHGILHLLGAGELPLSSDFAIDYALSLGTEIKAYDIDVAGHRVGSDVFVGAALGARLLNKALLIGPEFYGNTVVADPKQAFDGPTTPMEIIGSAHYTIAKDWRVGLGAGPGIGHGYGTPDYRLLASFEWTPHYEPPPPAEVVGDRDHDGIPDNRDACPDNSGPRDANPALHGCPPQAAPADRDGDGIIDAEDACPDVPGVRTNDPKTNGCPPPPPDRDKDGIVDAEDACPDVPGVKTDDPKTNGCPPDPDRDKDGIKNEEDACPDVPGVPDPDPKKNGCPKAQIVHGQIQINEQVKFATGSAVILKDSDNLLSAVAKILTDHPEIKKLRVEGHTDNVGGKAYNQNLSNARAASVMAWLVKHGIDKGRLTSQGFGMDKPIDTNTTAEGRTNNRRVEFHIAEGPGSEEGNK